MKTSLNQDNKITSTLLLALYACMEHEDGLNYTETRNCGCGF